MNAGFRLWVHIADVAHFIQPGEAIDREAQRRGTSVYFPGKVVPMLPPRISDDLCSLRPGVERLVQSVILDLDAKGEPTKVRFADGLIRSAARLTYTQVADAIFYALSPDGVVVEMEAQHLCMSMRGVQKPDGRVVTSAVRGRFETRGLDHEGLLALLRRS